MPTVVSSPASAGLLRLKVVASDVSEPAVAALVGRDDVDSDEIDCAGRSDRWDAAARDRVRCEIRSARGIELTGKMPKYDLVASSPAVICGFSWKERKSQKSSSAKGKGGRLSPSNVEATKRLGRE